MSRTSSRRPATGRGARTDGAAAAGSGWEGAGRVRAARLRATGDPGVEPTADPATPPRPRTPPRRPDRATPARAEQIDAGRRRFADLVRGRRRPHGSTRAPGRPVPPRYRRRRLAAALTAVLALLVAVGLGTRVLLYDAGFADVQDVTVTGLSTVPEQAVRDAAAVAPGGPLIEVDTAGAAQRVAALEGVAAVDVRRAWPHTVEVRVTERVPVALWPTPQAVFEVDGTGLPYRRAPQPLPALPRLAFAGVGPQDPSTAAALGVLHDLPDPLRAQVATVDAAGTKVALGLSDGRSVRWGDPERSADKIAVLGPLLGQPGSVYDVSSPDLPTVRP